MYKNKQCNAQALTRTLSYKQLDFIAFEIMFMPV